MLKILMQLLGVDYEQWRALTRTAIMLDLRSVSLGQPANQSSGEPKSAAGQLIARLWVYVLLGGTLGIIVGVNKDVFFTGTILVTYTMVMSAMLVLLDFGAIVISPDDFAILGYQPVSSQTYFVSRLTNVLIYSTLLSLALGIIPVIVFFFTLGFNPLLGFSALAAILFGGIAATLFLVFIYAGILRVIHPNKLRRAVGYIQLVMSFLIFGGYIFLPRIIEMKNMKTMTLAKEVWLFLFPSTWFASYLDLARGYWRLTEIVPALLSLMVLGILFVRARGKLALDYADRLSSAMAVSEGPKKISKSTSRRSWFFRKGESRAVSLLVRNQFKYDQKFRLAVLGILPITVIYLFMGLRKGPMADSFINHNMGMGDSWLLYFAVLMFPIMLNATLANSDAYQASWIYYATPADRSRLVLASKNFVFAFFVIPYLIFLGALFFYFWRNPWHVIVHLGVLMLLSHLFMQVAVLLNPVLPFSMPSRKAQRSASLIAAMIFVPIAAIGLLFIFTGLLYPHPPLLAGAIAFLMALSCLLEFLLKRRVQRRTAAMEYQG
jgi:ABC-2 type transport system permease protein